MDIWAEEDEDEEAAFVERLEDPEVLANLPRAQRSRGLVIVARRADTKLCMAILNHGASVNEEDECGYTPVMYAAMHGLHGCLSLMLEQTRCIVNKRTHSMETALHFAAKKGHSACAELLLNNGAMVNVADDWGETPLILSVSSGSLDAVKVLLSHGAKLDNIDLRGMDALMFAARDGHQEILHLLIKHGSDVNRVQKTSAIHQAAIFGHVQCVRTLLSMRARPHLQDIHHVMPIALATHTDQHEVVRCLLDYVTHREDLNTALIAAAKSNASRSLEILLDHGASPGSVDMQGVPTFFSAVALNHKDIVRSLIRHSVHMNKSLNKAYLLNTELRDVAFNLREESVTPLTIAALRSYSAMVRLLVQGGANATPFLHLDDTDQLPTGLTASDPGLLPWVLQKSRSPRTLAFFARKKIRGHLTSDTGAKIQGLPLPKTIKDYLNFADLLHL